MHRIAQSHIGTNIGGGVHVKGSPFLRQERVGGWKLVSAMGRALGFVVPTIFWETYRRKSNGSLHAGPPGPPPYQEEIDAVLLGMGFGAQEEIHADVPFCCHRIEEKDGCPTIVIGRFGHGQGK